MPYELDAAFLTEPFQNIDRGNHLVATDFFAQKCRKESVGALFSFVLWKYQVAVKCENEDFYRAKSAIALEGKTPGSYKGRSVGYEEIIYLCGSLLVRIFVCHMLYGNGNCFGYGVSKDYTADRR